MSDKSRTLTMDDLELHQVQNPDSIKMFAAALGIPAEECICITEMVGEDGNGGDALGYRNATNEYDVYVKADYTVIKETDDNEDECDDAELICIEEIAFANASGTLKIAYSDSEGDDWYCSKLEFIGRE